MQDRHREFLEKIRLPKESAQKTEDSRKLPVYFKSRS